MPWKKAPISGGRDDADPAAARPETYLSQQKRSPRLMHIPQIPVKEIAEAFEISRNTV